MVKRWAILALLFAGNCFAATWFVRPTFTGTHNGTSWATAWNGAITWASLNAGDTVCMAGGTYTTGLSSGKAGTSGNPITVKRAIASDAQCGSGTSGWDGSYDAQVNIGHGGISITHSYVTIDGMVDNGIYGFMNNGDDTYAAVEGGSTGAVLRYVEISGPGTPSGINQNSDSRSLSVGYHGSATYALVSHVNVHGSCMNMIIFTAFGLIVEHSRLADSIDHTPGNSNCHPNVFEVFGGTIAFRYNEIVN